MLSDIKYFTSLLLQRLLSETEHYLKIKYECIYNAFNKFKHKKDIVINRVSTSILIFGIKNVLPFPDILQIPHWYMLVTARKRSLRRLCFYTCLSFILFTGGSTWPGTPPGADTPPRPGTPPGTRYTPRTKYTPQTRYPPDQVHPPGPGTPPLDQVPPDKVHPLGPGTPPNQVHPPGPGIPPRTRYPPWTRYTPPWSRAGWGRYGQRAGGPHPTGMQSCFVWMESHSNLCYLESTPQ